LTVGGGAVRFPIEAGRALKDVIEAPSLDVVRGLDARTNIGYAVEPGAASDSEPDVHEDYVSAYDLGRFAESARFVRHYPEQNPVLRDLLPTITTPTQILAGRDDDLVPWSNNQYLDDLLAEQRDSSSRRGSLRVGASSRGIRPPGRRLGQRRVLARRSGLTPRAVRDAELGRRAEPLVTLSLCRRPILEFLVGWEQGALPCLMTTPGAAPNVQFGAYGPVAAEEPSAAPNGGSLEPSLSMPHLTSTSAAWTCS